jgi:hypothetical protein
LNTVFEIGSLSADHGSDSLFIEVGESFCSIALINISKKSAQFIGVYAFDAISLNESVDALLKTILNKKSTIVNSVISPAFPEALLIPNKFYHHKSSLLNAVFNQAHYFPLNDAIAEWQLINVYTLPMAVYKKMMEQLPGASFLHAYTPLLKIYNGFTAEHQISAHFIGKQFRVMVKKNHHVQLVQTYSYTSPLDVVYYLLKICAEFQLPQEETQIIISGLIDEDSALYKELHHYFLHLHFATNTTLSLPEHEHPGHFFTSIHNLAACVL